MMQLYYESDRRKLSLYSASAHTFVANFLLQVAQRSKCDKRMNEFD